jgi:hypothetical protein
MLNQSVTTLYERRWIVVFAAVVLLITSIPYLLGFTFQDGQNIFSGFVIGVEDGNSYIAKMHAGSAGAWLFRTPYTAFPQNGALMFLPYLLLGKLAAAPDIHVQLVVLFHIFRLFAGFLAILATYDFLAFFLQDVRTRRFGLVLVILGGGLGWILMLLGQQNWLGSLPLDFYSPESFGFLSIFGFPHLTLARALLLWCLLAYLRAVRDQSVTVKTVVTLSGLWLLAGIFQPLVMLVIGALIGLHLFGMAIWLQWKSQSAVLTWQSWRSLLRLWVFSGILPGFLVIYNLWILWTDPFISSWTQQNIIKSPHPLHYLLAYGLLLPFAWVGGRRLMRTNPQLGWLPVSWVLMLPVLAYAPVNLQRRLPEGIWVAWVLLAMVSLEPPLEQPSHQRYRLLWPSVVLLLTIPSTVVLIIGGIMSSANTSPPIFRRAGEIAAFEILRQEAQVGEVALTAYDTGNALPAWAPLRVVIGHGPESIHLAPLRSQVADFFSPGTTDAERVGLLRKFRISYVFWGYAERELGDWDPHQAPYLQLMYDDNGYSIFKVDLYFTSVSFINHELIAR